MPNLKTTEEEHGAIIADHVFSFLSKCSMFSNSSLKRAKEILESSKLNAVDDDEKVNNEYMEQSISVIDFYLLNTDEKG